MIFGEINLQINWPFIYQCLYGKYRRFTFFQKLFLNLLFNVLSLIRILELKQALIIHLFHSTLENIANV